MHTEFTINIVNNSTQRTSVEQLGCPIDRFNWCDTLHSMNIYVFYGAFSIALAFGWPLVNLSLITILSNILGPRPQACMQTINYAFGDWARLMSPAFMR